MEQQVGQPAASLFSTITASATQDFLISNMNGFNFFINGCFKVMKNYPKQVETTVQYCNLHKSAKNCMYV
jgi:hypothetical protein